LWRTPFEKAPRPDVYGQMKRRQHTSEKRNKALDELFASVAGIVRLAARQSFWRLLLRSREETLLFLKSKPAHEPPKERR
jgi:hypothetical protein